VSVNAELELAYDVERPARSAPFALIRATVAFYLAAIVAAEAVVDFLGVTGGLIVEAALLLVLVTHYVVAVDRDPRSELARDHRELTPEVLPIIALVPLARILSVTVPVEEISRLYWYAMVGAPLLLAAWNVSRLSSFHPAGLGLRVRSWPAQLQIGLAGVPLGLSAYVILRPDEITTFDLPHLLVAAVVLLVLSGFVEEVIFRGLLQRGLAQAFGPAGIPLASAIFAASYLGAGSAAYVAFIAVVGLVFGWAFERTGSLVGVSIAHGLLNLGLIVFWPAVLG
jgi:uncharacterized protein